MTNMELNAILDANIEQMKTMIILAQQKLAIHHPPPPVPFGPPLPPKPVGAPPPVPLPPPGLAFTKGAPAAVAPAAPPLLLTERAHEENPFQKSRGMLEYIQREATHTRKKRDNPTLLLKNAPEDMPTGHDAAKWKEYAQSLTKGEKPNETTHRNVGTRVAAILKWAKTADEAGVPPEFKDDYNQARYSLIAAGSAIPSTTGGRKKKRTRRIKYRSRH